MPLPEQVPYGEHECTRCGAFCVIEGDFPRYFAWCDECDDDASGFDALAYAKDVAADIADGRPDTEGGT